MADEINATDESSSAESTETTSDAAELSPEQRDEQTIARAFGLDQGQDSADESETEDSDESDESDEESADESETEDEETEADETETEDEADDPEADEAASDEESDADDDVELSDEDIDTFLDAAEDRVISNPRIVKKLEALVQAQVDRQVQRQREQMDVSQETEQLLQQGVKSAEAIINQFVEAGEAITKLVEGEDLDKEVALNPEELKKHLRQYAVASALQTRQGYDQAFASAFREVAPLSGEKFTEEEAKGVVKLVETADRIRNDPQQGEAAANAYLFRESFKLLVERAKAAGKAEAESERKKRIEATKRIIGEKNSNKAALAKVANKRKKLPKKSPKAEAEQSETAPSVEAYRAAKLSGDYDKADQILAAMQGAGQGQPIPGR